MSIIRYFQDSQEWFSHLKKNNKALVFLVDDKILAQNSFISDFLQKQKYLMPLQAGEELKNLESFATKVTHFSELVRDLAKNEICILAVGGGSLGDFSGFLASVFKRGVDLIQVPSTWLSALDSSHGGKTALNVSGLKNQIGSFYMPKETHILKDLLMSQPDELLQDAAGEIAKSIFLSSQTWSQAILKNPPALNSHWFWLQLPHLIDVKLKIVEKDPKEEKGLRRVLNLGHTLGHVFESHYKWSHGYSVSQGLHFAIDWSLDKDYLGIEEHKEMKSFLNNWRLERNRQKMPTSEFRKTLLQDKKRVTKQEVDFVFLKGLGLPHRESIQIEKILEFAQKEEWIQ